MPCVACSSALCIVVCASQQRLQVHLLCYCPTFTPLLFRILGIINKFICVTSRIFFLNKKVCEGNVCWDSSSFSLWAVPCPSRHVWLAPAPILRHRQPSRERGQFGCSVMQKDKYWMRVSAYKLFVGPVVALVFVLPGTWGQNPSVLLIMKCTPACESPEVVISPIKKSPDDFIAGSSASQILAPAIPVMSPEKIRISKGSVPPSSSTSVWSPQHDRRHK